MTIYCVVKIFLHLSITKHRRLREKEKVRIFQIDLAESKQLKVLKKCLITSKLEKDFQKQQVVEKQKKK